MRVSQENLLGNFTDLHTDLHRFRALNCIASARQIASGPNSDCVTCTLAVPSLFEPEWKGQSHRVQVESELTKPRPASAGSTGFDVMHALAPQ